MQKKDKIQKKNRKPYNCDEPLSLEEMQNTIMDVFK